MNTQMPITATRLRCPKCGHTKIWKRLSTQRSLRGFTLGWCSQCRRFRFFRIEKTD